MYSSENDMGNFDYFTNVQNMHALFGIAVWRSNIAIVLRQFKSVLLDLFLQGSFDYLDFCSRNGLSTLYERRDLLARQFFFKVY